MPAAPGGPAQSTPTTQEYEAKATGRVRTTLFPLDPLCFNFEEKLQFASVKQYQDQTGKKGLDFQPVFLVDPCQSGITPLKTQTIYPFGVDIKAPQNTVGASGAATFTGSIASNSTTPAAGTILEKWNVLENRMLFGGFYTGLASTALAVVLQIRNCVQILAIHQVATGGTGTATLTVEGSVDNSTWLVLDSIAAAATIDLQYTLGTNALNGAAQAATVAGTGAGTVKLNPLAFQYVRITLNAGASTAVATASIMCK